MTRLVIERLGSNGEGMAMGENGPVHVPFALPGEAINAAVLGKRADLVSVLQASPDRVVPACPHFGECGGCALQHLAPGLYRDFKRGLVVDALRQHRIDAEVAPLLTFAPASRRRLALTVRRHGETLPIGFRRAQSHDLVAITQCPVARAELVTALPSIARVAGEFLGEGKSLRALATLTSAGIDLAVDGEIRTGEAARRAAIAGAGEAGFARLAANGEVLIELRAPQVDAGGTVVAPPPGGFLQAVADAEEAMAALVSTHLAGRKRIVDLFSGSGAFALRLARTAEVHAVEGDAASLAALERAFRSGSGLRRITVERRDLFRRPVLARDLDKFQGLVFDPPRAGAEDQCRQIARSQVPAVAAVSCNPGTLARDLRILLDGGYRLLSVTPVDQFLWSAHVEAVALLDRPRR